jgi:DNA-directed RNA polymerase sigma subunit (sigma70/sigma32)
MSEADQIYQLIGDVGALKEANRNLEIRYAEQKKDFDDYVRNQKGDNRATAHLILSILAVVVSIAGFVTMLIFNISKKP